MLTWRHGRTGRREGWRVRGADRRGRVEERGAPAGAVAPVLSLLGLRHGRRETVPTRAAPLRDEGHLAWLPGRDGGRAPGGGGGAAGRPAGSRGGARSGRGAPEGGGTGGA